MATRRTDQDIVRDVREELEWDPAVDIHDLGVIVDHGHVTLTGMTDTYGGQTQARAAAYRVDGVRQVTDLITVDAEALGRTDDAQITERVRRALELDTTVPSDQITVNVFDGVVVLGGWTTWHYQRTYAEAEASSVYGVRSVVNDIKVRPLEGATSAMRTNQVRATIRRALERNARVDADGIAVEVDGGRVTLNGAVCSYAERQEAENAAWRSPAVTTVVNEITVA